MAGGPVEADGGGAVVDVLAAALARPTVDADAGVTALGVEAGAPVVAGVGLQLALVHILGAELAWGGGDVEWGRGVKEVSVSNRRNLLGGHLRTSQGAPRSPPR